MKLCWLLTIFQSDAILSLGHTSLVSDKHVSAQYRLQTGEIRWEESIRYLGVHITWAKAFACSLANAMKSFYGAFNAVFGKVAGVASEEVTVELLKVKYLPVLLYGLEACPSNKQFNSLDFVLKGCFRKIFRTRSAEVVQNCMLIFNCLSYAGVCCQT